MTPDAVMSAPSIQTKYRTLAVVGLGYVGLPSAVNFAERGFKVIGADVNRDAVRRITAGEAYLSDLGLDARVQALVKKGVLSAVTDVADATRRSDAVLIMVPTPLKEDHEPDLSYVIAAGQEIAKGLRKGHLVILESTVYPGVTEDVLRPELERSGFQAGKDFGLAHCPERYNPGDSDHTIDRTRRIVGGVNVSSTDDAAALYGTITKAGVVKVRDVRVCEAAKVIENTQRDLNIALMNEFALILERLGLDVEEVLDAAATKWNFLRFRPGPGVGGHCLPKDPYLLVKTAQRAGYQPQVITAGRRINDAMPGRVHELVVEGLRRAGKGPKGSRVAVLGLSYKENIGDTRQSPALDLTRRLHESGASILTVDCFVGAQEAAKSFHSERHFTLPDDLPTGLDAVVFVVPHSRFLPLDLEALAKRFSGKPVFVDGCRRVAPESVEKVGFTYLGVGAGRHNGARPAATR